MVGPVSVTRLTQWPQGFHQSGARCELTGSHTGMEIGPGRSRGDRQIRIYTDDYSSMRLHSSATIEQ